VGVQNYTCNSTGSWIQSGANNGAKATLYNVTSYLSQHQEAVPLLPTARLALYKVTGQCATESNILPALPVLGEHYFTAQGIPTFDLNQAQPSPLFLNAAKDGDIKAPNAANIDWLYLEYNGTGTATGLTSVYRVETAGGVAPSSCSSAQSGKQTSIPYAAEYWFYD